jgi:uncharacterized protein (TIGR02453 family)
MKQILDFLQQLRENNSKEWMDENRKFYEKAKKIWLEKIALMLKELSSIEPDMAFIQPKNTITRINNNRRFHPDRPIYKDNFTFTPSASMVIPSIHVSVSPGNSFIGGGLYMPDNELLSKIREAIDYDGEILESIISEPDFVKFFGGLDEDKNMLKTAPKGYPKDHIHIDLLRRKNFVVIYPMNDELVISNEFIPTVKNSFILMKPLLDYLNKAINYIE